MMIVLLYAQKTNLNQLNNITLFLLKDLCYKISRTEKNYMTHQACQALRVKESRMYNINVECVEHDMC